LIAVGIGTVAVIGGLWSWSPIQDTTPEGQNRRLRQDERETGHERRTVGEARHDRREAGPTRWKTHAPRGWLRTRARALLVDEGGHEPILSAAQWRAAVQTVSKIDFKQPEIAEKGVIADFPYKWAVFPHHRRGPLSMIGKFIADFENAFPFFSIRTLISPFPRQGGHGHARLQL